MSMAAGIFLTNPTIHTEISEVPEHTLGLSISRSIGGGIHEDMDSSKRRPVSPATSAARPAISCATRCRGFIRAYSATRPTFRFNIWAPSCRRHGRRDRLSPCFRCSSAFRPTRGLHIDPVLPEWLPQLTIRDLQVDENVFDLRFWRDGDATRFETLKGDSLAVVRKRYATANTRCL